MPYIKQNELADLARWARHVVGYLQDGRPEEARDFAELVSQHLTAHTEQTERTPTPEIVRS